MISKGLHICWLFSVSAVLIFRVFLDVMKLQIMRRAIGVLVLLLTGVSLQAHGELDKRIKEITVKILQDPDNTSLFLSRGELYCQHEDYELSIKDFKVCEERGYISDRLNLNFAKSYRLYKDYDLADQYADLILSEQPNHVLALKSKAKSAFAQAKYEQSAALFNEVINHVDVTHTDNYIEAANALESCGTNDCLRSALEVIENGIQDLGELMVFLDKGVNISLRRKDFETAHQYQNKIIENAQRKERKYFQKALLYKEQGKTEEAQQMFQNSLVELESLPNRIKQNRASIKLKNQIQDQLSTFQ